MKAKKFLKHTLIIGLVLTSFASCDDKLDEPLENFPLGNRISAEGQFEMLVGAYQDLYRMGWEIHPTIGLRGDDVNKGGGSDQREMGLMDDYNYDPSSWFFNNTWNEFYSDIITTYYLTIEEIEDINLVIDDSTAGNQYIAEIKVMIGFDLLQLVRLWGDILIPSSSSAIDFENLPVIERAEVLQHISDLMDEAIPVLPNMRPNQRTDIPGGVTRYTALAVKAMANLDLENFTEAANATSEIIQSGLFSLESDYYNLFKMPGELNDETLLEFQYSDLGSQSTAIDDFNHGYSFYGPLGAGWFPAVAGVQGGWGFWEPTFKYIQFMLDREDLLRLETSVLFTPDGVEALEDLGYTDLPTFTAVSSTPSGAPAVFTRDGDGFGNHIRALFHSGKHVLPSNQISNEVFRFNSGKNFIVIRYAEILLMHAEALVSGASSTSISALEAVNLVRERANMDPLANVTLDDVLNEKYAEFAMEWGIRFADVVRHGRTGELNEGGKVYDPSNDRFLPYPIEQVDLLPQLNR